VGGQVAFPGSHLMDTPTYELVQPYKGSLAHGGRVVVLPPCREQLTPRLEEGLPQPFLQAEIGVIH